MLPTNWEVEDENDDAVFIGNQRMNLIMIISRFPAEEVGSDNIDDSFIIPFCQTAFNNYSRYAIEEDTNTTLADGSPARWLLFTCYSSAGESHQNLLLLVPSGAYTYLFLATAFGMDLSSSQRNALREFFARVYLSTPQVFGHERSETLVLLSYEPEAEDLDPARMTSSAGDYTGLLFSGLVRLSPELQIEPDLAESWVVSPDGVVYTFTLRAGITFQSGKPITAADVKYSWERAANPDTESPTAATYLNDIAGVTEMLAGDAEELTSVVAIDERTLQVTLSGPVPYFLAKLTYPTAFIVDESDVKSRPNNWMFHPNASGPFTLEELRDGEAIIFARNDAYYSPPQVRYVVFLFSHGGAHLSYFEAGDVDIVSLYSDEASQVAYPNHPLHDRLTSTTEMCTTFLYLNNTLPPLDDDHVRRALSLALDRDRLVELFYENLALRADTILPPAMPGFSGGSGLLTFDPDAARQALADSAYASDMPTIILTLRGYPTDDNPYADAIINMWRENLGIEVEIEYLAPEQFTQLARQQHGHIVSSGWCADYPDPQNFLDILFHSASEFNISGYTNPELDALLEAARVELDAVTSLGLYQQIETLLLQDYAAIPLVHTTSFQLVSAEVQGYVNAPIGIAIYHRVWLTRTGAP